MRSLSSGIWTFRIEEKPLNRLQTQTCFHAETANKKGSPSKSSKMFLGLIRLISIKHIKSIAKWPKFENILIIFGHLYYLKKKKTFMPPCRYPFARYRSLMGKSAVRPAWGHQHRCPGEIHVSCDSETFIDGWSHDNGIPNCRINGISVDNRDNPSLSHDNPIVYPMVAVPTVTVVGSSIRSSHVGKAMP